MNAEQFKNYIKKVVREEINTSVAKIIREEMERSTKKLVKEHVNEMLAGMLLENLASGKPVIGNSQKARTLRESAMIDEDDGYEEYPTMGEKPFDRSRMAELLGYGTGMAAPEIGGASAKGLITVDSMNSAAETGNPIPVNPNDIPDHVLEAFNKDYRPMMQALAAKKLNNG